MHRISAFLVAMAITLPFLALAAPEATESPTPQAAIPDNRPLGLATMDKANTLLANYSFNSGPSPDSQGWTMHDRTEDARKFIHVDDFFSLIGTRSVWCGALVDPTDPETAEWYGPGYGNNWRQEWLSRAFVAPSTDPMHLTYTMNWTLVPNFDFIFIHYRVDGGEWQIAKSYSTGVGFETNNISVSIPAGSEIQYRFRFESNGSGSNADGYLATIGAFRLDDLRVRNGATNILSEEDFESDPIGATQTLSGDWYAQVVPGFGNYAALDAGSQVRQDEAASFNDTHFWTFFAGSPDLYDCSGIQPAVPVGENTYHTRFHNEIRSPWQPLDLGANPRSVKVAYDAYLDSPLYLEPPGDNSVFHRVSLHFRDAAGNILRTASSAWWYGLIQAWRPYHHQFNLPPGAVDVQVRFEVQSLFESACHRHAPLFDNVQISQTPAYTVTNSFSSGFESLHWAITEANANPGADRIDFSTVSTIIVLAAPLPAITEPLHIAGFSNLGAQPNTLTGASDAIPGFELISGYVSGEPCLDLQADGCVIEGLAIRDFSGGNIRIESNQNTVRGCWLGITDADEVFAATNAHNLILDGVGGGSTPTVGNTIGGPTPADQNVICNVGLDGIDADYNQQLLIQGNLIGLLPDGQTAASVRSGISMLWCDDSALLDNVIAGCTVTSGSAGIQVYFGSDHVIRGNIIGLSGDQSQAVPNSGDGISFGGLTGWSYIGGSGPGEGNVIAGNGRHGVALFRDGPSSGSAVQVLGNHIGTDATGTRTDLGNGGHGVFMDQANPYAYFIGFGNHGNVIAYNAGAGIKATGTMTGLIGYRANSIHHNGGLEIDLTEWTGYQEAVPVITQADMAFDTITVGGQVTGWPNGELEIDLFVSRDCDDPGDPQAEIYIGSAYTALDGLGIGDFTHTATGAFLPGDVVTGIAVHEDPSVSAIGACFTAINTPEGSPVEVLLPNATVTSYPVTVVFDQVTSAGVTSAHLGSDSVAPPAEGLVFKVFTITTSAAFTPGLGVCYDFSDLGVHPNVEPHLELLQLDLSVVDGPWLPITTSVDQLNNRICGQTAELGPDGWGCFAIVYPDGATDVPASATAFRLLPNVPNPFNPSTLIRFELPRDSRRVTVDIYDLAGHHVRRLMDGPAGAGLQTLNWNGKDDAGRQVVSGVYPLRLVDGREVRLQRLVLLK